MSTLWTPNRRLFLGGLSAASASALLPGGRCFAEELQQTAPVGEGPFYPDKLPLDTDNDLLVVNDSITPAVGEVTHLSGKVLTKTGAPIRNAFVEIWQVDNNGVYLHSSSNDRPDRDRNFQGYGRFLTDHTGRYYFRTVKPVAYPGRTPHIHFGISKNGRRIFTTQLLIKGDKRNLKDGLYKRLKNEAQRNSILSEFKPLQNSRIGELVADFDIVLGVTPQEMEDGSIRGIGKSEYSRRQRRG